MTMESQLLAVLGPLVGGRAYPDFAPEDAALPYVTYQAVGGQPINYTEGSVPDIENARVQINVWAARRIPASELGKQVEDAMRLAPSLRTTVITGRVATFDEETGYRGTRQDFSIYT